MSLVRIRRLGEWNFSEIQNLLKISDTEENFREILASRRHLDNFTQAKLSRRRIFCVAVDQLEGHRYSSVYSATNLLEANMGDSSELSTSSQ